MIGRVGQDNFGEILMKNLNEARINTSLMQVDYEKPTGIAAITVDMKGNNSIIVVPGANMQLLPEQVEAVLEKIEPFTILLMQLEIPLETVKYAAAVARQKGAIVILNPAPAAQLIGETLDWIDIIVPNEIEACQLANQLIKEPFDNEGVVNQLVKQGAKSIIITLGDQGAIIVDEKFEIIRIPGFNVQAIDSTAAGDAFIGGLAVALIEGKNLRQAVKFSNAAGALTVTRPGAQSSLPDRNELDQFLGLQ
jgi:ribokinase